MRKIVLFVLCTLFYGYVVASDNVEIDLGDGVGKWEVSSGLGYLPNKPGETAYLVKSAKGKWEYESNAHVSSPNVERVKIDLNLRRIFLDAPHLNLGGEIYSFPSNTRDCVHPAERKQFYHVCLSNFVKRSGNSIEMDMEAFSQAVKDSGVIQRIIEKQEYERKWAARKKYRDEFFQANTPIDLEKFAEKYKSDDPESLVPKAIEKAANLKKTAAEEAKQREQAEIARIAAQTKEEAEQRKQAEIQRKQEEVRRKQDSAQLTSFRRGIKMTSKTNCGPVLEIKGALIKVYFPIQNYGNEHWINKDEVFPPGKQCDLLIGKSTTVQPVAVSQQSVAEEERQKRMSDQAEMERKSREAKAEQQRADAFERLEKWALFLEKTCASGGGIPYRQTMGQAGMSAIQNGRPGEAIDVSCRNVHGVKRGAVWISQNDGKICRVIGNHPMECQY